MDLDLRASEDVTVRMSVEIVELGGNNGKTPMPPAVPVPKTRGWALVAWHLISTATGTVLWIWKCWMGLVGERELDVFPSRP